MKIKLKYWMEITLAIVIAFILSMVFFACDSIENPMGPDLDPIINPPNLIVTCSADVLEGDAPLTIGFTGTASGGAEPYSYAWDFGDGHTGNGQVVNHIYSEYGRYIVVLTVTDNNNVQSTCTINDIVVHSEHIVYWTIIGETPELVDCSLYLYFEEANFGGWFSGATTMCTWDNGRQLKNGEYNFKLVLFRHNLVPWSLITTIPFKYSFTFWTNDENVEINPSSGDSGWFYFTGEGDYREWSFTVKETI